MNQSSREEVIIGRFGIFRKVFISSLLIALLSIIIIGIYTSITMKDVADDIGARTTKILNQKTIDALELQATLTAKAVEDFLYSVENDLNYIANIPPVENVYLTFYNKTQSAVWEKGLSNQTKIIPLYKEISYVNENGQELLKVNDLGIVPARELKNISDPQNTRYRIEDYFFNTINLKSDEIFVSRLTGFFVDKKKQLQNAKSLDDAPGDIYYDGVIRFCKPIYRDGLLKGIVVLALDQRHLMEFTQHILPLSSETVLFPSYKSGNYAFMFDDEGWITTHPKLWDIRGIDSLGNWVPAYTQRSTKQQIERGLIPFNLDSAGFIHENYPYVAKQVRNKQSGTVLTKNVGGITKMMAYAPISYDKGSYADYGIFGGITVGAEIIDFHLPARFVKDEIEAVFGFVQTNFLWVLLFTLFLASVTAWLLSLEFAKPILKITHSANEIAEGDLSKKIDISRNDEIGVLATTFNNMAEQLKKSRAILLETIDELKASKVKTELYANELEYQIKILESIQRISNILGSTFDMNTVIRFILEDSVKSIGFDRAILYLIDEKQKYMECKEIYGFMDENEDLARSSKYNLQRFDCIETRVVKEGRIIFVDDYKTYKEATVLDNKIRKYTKSNSFVYVPLKVKEKIIGIFGADKLRSKNSITNTDINSLQILANQASRVIENTLLYQEIINQRNFVEDVLKYMLNGVITIDGKGNITSFNKAAEEILQIKNKVPFAHNEREVFQTNIRTVHSIRKHLLTNGSYIGYNIRVKGKSEIKYLNINASLMQSKGNTPYGIIILEDVTDKKQLDDQIQHLEKLASLGKFTASIAHEIRNPLTGISLFLDDLHDRTANQPEIANLVEMALAEIERLEKLTHETLIYTHPASGEYSYININDTISEILNFVNKQCQNSNIAVNIQLNQQIGSFYFNPDRMRQALLNVFLNAIQVMKDGGKLTVSTESVRRIPFLARTKEIKNKDGYIKIRIQDTGPGISPSDREKIFEPFYSSKPKGSGLGLSLTYSIISEHQGIIRVSGKKGSGAIFTIYLPLTKKFTAISNN